MPASIKEIKKRITSTKKTGQITKAMYMVSQSKVKKSERTYQKYGSFLEEIKSLTHTALKQATDYKSPLLEERLGSRDLYLLISSDTGLAGGYNNQVFKYFSSLASDKENDIYVAAIGRKAYYYLNSNDYNLINKTPIMIRDDVMYVDIQGIVSAIIKMYLEDQIDHVYIIYNHKVNSLTCEVKEELVLPITEIDGTSYEGSFVFEGDIEESLDSLLKMYLSSYIYGIVLDSKTAEHTSRMNAMKNASDNVDEIVKKYGLIYNRARQSAITTELTDIIAGSNAVKTESNDLSKQSVSESIQDIIERKDQIRYVTIYSKNTLDIKEETKIILKLKEVFKDKEIRLIKKIDLDITDGYYFVINNTRIDFNLDDMLRSLKASL